jgi:hypothetical protein
MSRSLVPSIAVLLVSNLVPLAGVLFWNWDLFLLLMLYWSETAIIGFWMAVSVVRYPPEGLHRASAGLTVAFFSLHAGGFMAGHLLFLWIFFAARWHERIHGLGDFVREIVIGSGLWLSVLAMFVARGVANWLDRPVGPAAGVPRRSQPSLLGFYARIVLMHVTILAGGILMQSFGPHAPLFLLIGLKIALDLGFEVAAHRTAAPANLRTTASGR